MQAAVRRPLAAGAAFVGASMIATSTIAPMPDVSLSAIHPPAAYTAAVDLLASSDVLAAYEKLFQDAGAGIDTIVGNAAPGQLLSQFILNQFNSAATLAGGLGTTAAGITKALLTDVPELVQAVIKQLAAGQFSDAVDSLIKIPLAVVLPATDILPALHEVLTKPLTNLVKIIDSLTADPLAATLLISGFIAPLISTPAAIAVAVQNVVEAFGTSPAAVFDALLKAPAVIADGFLNGGYGPDLGGLVQPGLTVKAGGLLSTSGIVFLPDGTFFVKTGGPIAALQQLIKQITDAITPAAPATAAIATADVASLPAATPTTVTLATTPTTEKPAAVPATGSDALPAGSGSDAGATPEDTAGAPVDADAPASPAQEAGSGEESAAPTAGGEADGDDTAADDGNEGSTSDDTKGHDTTGHDTAGKPAKGHGPTGKGSTDKDSDGSADTTAKPRSTAGSDRGAGASSHETKTVSKADAA
jgi:hypothetical protein